MAMRLVEPRIVAALWWEHLMFVVAAWVAVVLGFAYFSGNGFNAYPGVLLSPFIPTVVAWVMRAGYKMPLDPADGPRLALDAFHLVSVPLGFILLFCKLWGGGRIPWAVVLLFPFLAVTRHLVETAHDLAFKMPRTVYASLGYGPREARPVRVHGTRRGGKRLIWRRRRPPFSHNRQAATAPIRRDRRDRREPCRRREPRTDAPHLPRGGHVRSTPSVAGGAESALVQPRGRSDRVCSAGTLPGTPRWMTFRGGDHHTVSVDGVQFTNIESPPQTQPQPRT